MRCIFVLDILNGAVVHAVRGERKRYEPIDRSSRIVSTSQPLRILEELKPREIYVADLNRLMREGDNWATIEAISAKTKTMADIGISDIEDLNKLPDAVSPILGTETASLGLIKEAALKRKIVVSIDMKGGNVLARDPLLTGLAPLQVLQVLNDLPLEAVILLEMSRVGTSSGLDLEFLEKAAAQSKHPLILGGGVKGEEDLLALEGMGFSGALVATAVHNGKIPLERIW
ncbi:MAG: nickel transporter [Methanothrix sp.]|nr:MAG: nickel transporter [Methanothrix sp.]